jgi:hypothetical protein
MTALPSYIDASLWTDFIEGRKEMQKQKIPFTAVAQKRLLMKCMKLHDDGFDVNQCLEEAICNCWRSVFPPKGAQKAQQAASFAQSDRQAGWARWEAQTGRIHPDRQPSFDLEVVRVYPQETLLENWNGTTHQSH